MNKGVFLLAAACIAAPRLLAQDVDSLSVLQDNADFTFTEQQLDEESEATQMVTTNVGAQTDPYATRIGFRWSSARFRARAYEYRYSQTLLNGLPMNDTERGGFSYSMLGGLNDATRSRESVNVNEFNNFTFAPIAGANNINMRPSVFAQGSRATISATNRSYILRGMFTHATGILPSGWAFAGSIGYRWAKEGNVEGTFYNSLGYFLGAEKRLNGGHALTLLTFGAPTERGTQTASTEEAYWLANSHYYNPNWGYQNGKKRNARVVRTFDPTALFTWDWKIDDTQKLSATAGFKYAHYSKSRLTYGDNGYDPRPDYYKNLPSSVFDVYDRTTWNNPDVIANNPWFMDQYNRLVDYWTSDKANRQIKWDELYQANQGANAEGKEAMYYQYRDHSNQMLFGLSSNYTLNIDEFSKLALGFNISHTKGMHFQTMADLLGANLFTDYDRFASRDYGHGSLEAQNDVRNPYKQVKEGDKFGYDYNIFVDKVNVWGGYELKKEMYIFTLGGNIEGTSIEREGLMQNGRALNNSLGKSGKARFLSGGGKTALTFITTNRNYITIGATATTEAPKPYNSFVAPRIQNNFVDNLTVEQIYGTDLNYTFRFGNLTGKIGGYYSKFLNGVEQTAFYNDQEGRFTYLTMSDVQKSHYGLEAAFVYQFTNEFSINLLGTISDARYDNNPYAQINYEGSDAKTTYDLNNWTNPVTGQRMPLRVMTKGNRLSGTPLTAVSLGASYRVNGWFFEADVNYFDRNYLGISQYRRLSNVLTSYTASSVDMDGNMVFDVTEDELKKNGGILFDQAGNQVDSYSPEQEKFKGGFILNCSIGKFIRLRHGKTLSINLSLSNLTNNTKLRTGGYEQNRGETNSDGNRRMYSFSNNPKYFYAYGFNAFLNIALRF